MGKTTNQQDKENQKEAERLRLLGKSREVLNLLKDETAQNAITIFNYLTQRIQGEANKEAQKRIVKDLCPEDLQV